MTCPHCGSGEVEPYWARSRNRYDTRDFIDPFLHTYYRDEVLCTDCGEHWSPTKTYRRWPGVGHMEKLP